VLDRCSDYRDHLDRTFGDAKGEAGAAMMLKVMVRRFTGHDHKSRRAAEMEHPRGNVLQSHHDDALQSSLWEDSQRIGDSCGKQLQRFSQPFLNIKAINFAKTGSEHTYEETLKRRGVFCVRATSGAGLDRTGLADRSMSIPYDRESSMRLHGDSTRGLGGGAALYEQQLTQRQHYSHHRFTRANLRVASPVVRTKETPSLEPFYTTNDHFTKTGSGQT